MTFISSILVAFSFLFTVTAPAAAPVPTFAVLVKPTPMTFVDMKIAEQRAFYQRQRAARAVA